MAALERLPRPRALVTTPFHLKTLLASGVALPAVELVLSATAHTFNHSGPQWQADFLRTRVAPLTQGRAIARPTCCAP